jgi:hypothetical protein
MKLIVHELEVDGVEQKLTATKNVIVEAVRPHLYRHNFPTGSLKVEIYTLADVLVAESENVDIADIGSEAFFHGYVRFFINAYLEKDTTYKFKLVGDDGYSFDESAYCGWCNSYDLEKYGKAYSPINSLRFPLDIEIWERKNR